MENPHASGLVSLARGIVAVLGGSWAEGADACRGAEEVFRSRCLDARWVGDERIWAEIDNAQVFLCLALLQAGRLDELNRLCPDLIKEAREHDDLSKVANLVNPTMTVLCLASGDPDGALLASRAAIDAWSQSGFHVQHHNALMSATRVDLYRGDAAAGMDRMRVSWGLYRAVPALRGSVPAGRLFEPAGLLYFGRRGGRATPCRSPCAAESDARRLDREGLDWSRGLAALVRAGVAVCRRDTGHTAAHLAAAIDRLSALGMALHADSARLRFGPFAGDDVGAAAAAQRLASLGVRDVERFADLFAPALPARHSETGNGHPRHGRQPVHEESLAPRRTGSRGAFRCAAAFVR